MPDHAFSKISSLAGPEIPARHQTLSHFLQVLLSKTQEQTADTLIQAIEADPMMLLHFLNLTENQPLADWHNGISAETMLIQGLTLANSIEQDASGQVWQRACLASELATVLSNQMSMPDQQQKRCRLLALLLSIGHESLNRKAAFRLPRSEQLESELRQYGIAGSVVGAQRLRQVGVSAADCDVLQYQYEDLQVLRDADQDLVLISMAGRLADAMLTDFELAEHYFELIEQKLEIDSEQLPKLLELAYGAFRTQNDLLLESDNFAANLARANLGQQLLSCHSQLDLEGHAKKIFGARDVHTAILQNSELQMTINGEKFSISASNSVLFQALNSSQPFSAEENALVAVVDKQIMSRLAANALWLLKVPDFGVAVMRVDQETGAMKDQFLCDAFAQACRATFSVPEEASELVALDFVQAQIRELTHEVNNPLAIVQNYLKTLSLKLDNDSPVQEDLKIIAGEMVRVGGLVQKYSAIGSATTAQMSEVYLNDLLKANATMFRSEQIEVVCQLDSNLPPIVTDAQALQQAIVNLLKNAIEALQSTPDGRVVLRTSGQVNFGGEHYVEIEIQDNGPSIDQAIYEQLFTAKRSTKGAGHSGLGLTVVHQIIADLGGHITCKTTADSGTLFQILLPRGKP